MNKLFFCSHCKNELFFNKKKLACKVCCEEFIADNQICIYPVVLKQKKNNQEVKNLISEIRKLGYDLAIENFIEKNQTLKRKLTYTKYDQSVDSIFHVIGNNNTCCLEIKSGFGNKVEILSNIFEMVYSIEFDDDLLEFQKLRFQQKKCDNILIEKCDLFKLPFPDNFFDMIVCNDVLNVTSELYDGDFGHIQNRIIKELKRVLNHNGKIVFGTDSNSSIKSIIKNNRSQHKDLQKQSYSNFKNLFEKNGLHVETFWAIPSFEKPYFSGNINDRLSLSWFFNNVDNFLGKKSLPKLKKIALALVSKLNFPFFEKLIEIFSPSFIFCCGKTLSNETLKNWIRQETNYENYLMLSRREKILFILINNNGIPEKIVSVRRYGNKFSKKLEYFQRIFPQIKDPENKAWVEDWFPGRSVNPLDPKEVSHVMNWLINFQKNSKKELMDEIYVNREIELIKKGLQFVNHGNLDQYYQWLEDYEKYVKKNKIFITATHGDFWITNILINPKTQKIHVLDWEFFKERGNPLLDFLVFLYNVMAMTENDPLKTFKKNIDGSGNASKSIKIIIEMIEEYFGFKMDIVLLLRYYLIRKMIPKEEEIKERISKDLPTKKDSLYVKMLVMLAKKVHTGNL
jgi:SAM-dependent methyltransferase/thiamine kinase-like enzyme